MMDRKVVTNLLTLSLPSVLVCLLIGEAAFRWVVPACQFPDRVWDPRWEIVRFDTGTGRTDGLYTAGPLAQLRARWHINAAGWTSAIDYGQTRDRARPRVAIIGDSFVEALHVDTDKSLTAVARGMLGPGLEIYSFGISGAPLSEYLQISRYVAAIYDPDVLVINVVHNDFDQSLVEVCQEPFFLRLRPDGDRFAEVRPSPYSPSGLRRVLKQSAAVRYVTENVGLRNALFLWNVRAARERFQSNVDVAALESRKDVLVRLTSHVVSAIAGENKGRAVLFMMDAPRDDLYAGTMRRGRVWWLHEALRGACLTSGVGFLDLADAFESHYAAHGQRFETPWDGHWNELGHRVAATALSRWLGAHVASPPVRAGARQ